MQFEIVPGPQEEIAYQHYHFRRLKFAFEKAIQYAKGTILEIGPYTITYNLIRNGFKVDTLGYLSEGVRGVNKHIEFDLDSLGKGGHHFIKGNYDLVIIAEVIEHLHLDLDRILRQLWELTSPRGVVIIQTPNATSLKKRMAMLAGKNPFQMIIDDYRPGYGGHLREFTRKELKTYSEKNGFEVLELHTLNYFDYSHSYKARMYKVLSNRLPQALRDGVTIVLKKSI